MLNRDLTRSLVLVFPQSWTLQKHQVSGLFRGGVAAQAPRNENRFKAAANGLAPKEQERR